MTSTDIIKRNQQIKQLSLSLTYMYYWGEKLELSFDISLETKILWPFLLPSGNACFNSMLKQVFCI